jgi:hypothetical protein
MGKKSAFESKKALDRQRTELLKHNTEGNAWFRHLFQATTSKDNRAEPTFL